MPIWVWVPKTLKKYIDEYLYPKSKYKNTDKNSGWPGGYLDKSWDI